MENIFSDSIPKDFYNTAHNEDAYAYSYDKQAFSLCDGASESYDSKSWANILSNHFISDPEVTEEWVMTCIQKYLKSLDLSSLTSSQLIAFQKGSFATFIGIVREKNQLKITNIGDSHVFLFTNLKNNECNLDNLELKKIFKKPNFSDNPTLLSTKIDNNTFINFSDLQSSHYYNTYDLDSEDKYSSDDLAELSIDDFNPSHFKDTYLVCATDAVAEWIFKYIEARKAPKIFQFLISLKNEGNEDKFRKTVALCRELKSMRVDDSTLVILKCEYNNDLS